MTMPHLMNCGHSDNGWCLACVKTLEDERYNTVIEAGKYEYALQAALQRQKTAEKQLAQLSEQLAKAEAEAKRYREAWASVRKQWDNEATIAAGWDVPSGDRLASLLRQCIDDMDDLIPPDEQGTTHD